MNKLLLSAIVCTLGIMTACTSDDDDDFSELIVGKWLFEYAYSVNLETGETVNLNYQNKTSTIVREDGTVDTIVYYFSETVLEFKADGTYKKYSGSGWTDGRTYSYSINGHLIVTHFVGEYDNTVTDIYTKFYIQTLNQSTLHFYQNREVIHVDNPEGDAQKLQYHMVYKRI